MERDERFTRANRAIKVGFWLNAVLMAVKLLAGYYGRSEAVLADGVESACDFIAISTTMIALSVGRKPFDDKHPYGHGKAESIAAILVSIVIFSTGGGILYSAWQSISVGHSQEPLLVAVLAACFTIIVKEGLYRYSIHLAGQLGSPAVMAIARDHRKDALTSVATLIGVTGAYFGVTLMDPVAAGLTAFFIFHIGFDTFRSAAHDLMDGQPPRELLTAIRILAEEVPGVEHVHEIRGRRSGQYVIVDLKLDMDPQMTVKESHDIATEVKRLVFSRFTNVGDVMIHVNPHDEEHEDLIRL